MHKTCIGICMPLTYDIFIGLYFSIHVTMLWLLDLAHQGHFVIGLDRPMFIRKCNFLSLHSECVMKRILS